MLVSGAASPLLPPASCAPEASRSEGGWVELDELLVPPAAVPPLELAPPPLEEPVDVLEFVVFESPFAEPASDRSLAPALQPAQTAATTAPPLVHESQDEKIRKFIGISFGVRADSRLRLGHGTRISLGGGAGLVTKSWSDTFPLMQRGAKS